MDSFSAALQNYNLCKALGELMELLVEFVDYAPEELHEQVPLIIKLLREIPGDDRPDYWIGKCIKIAAFFLPDQ